MRPSDQVLDALARAIGVGPGQLSAGWHRPPHARPPGATCCDQQARQAPPGPFRRSSHLCPSLNCARQHGGATGRARRRGCGGPAAETEGARHQPASGVSEDAMAHAHWGPGCGPETAARSHGALHSPLPAPGSGRTRQASEADAAGAGAVSRAMGCRAAAAAAACLRARRREHLTCHPAWGPYLPPCVPADLHPFKQKYRILFSLRGIAGADAHAAMLEGAPLPPGPCWLLAPPAAAALLPPPRCEHCRSLALAQPSPTTTLRPLTGLKDPLALFRHEVAYCLGQRCCLHRQATPPTLST